MEHEIAKQSSVVGVGHGGLSPMSRRMWLSVALNSCIVFLVYI